MEKENILYTVVKLRLDSHKNWEFKYCKCYCIVLHIMLFLIDFLKKGCELFSLFSHFFPHYVCAVSPSNLTPCSLPTFNHNAFFKVKKKVNKRTIRSVCHFSQAFIWTAKVWQRYIFTVAYSKQSSSMNRHKSAPSYPSFGGSFFSPFHISWIWMFLGEGKKTFKTHRLIPNTTNQVLLQVWEANIWMSSFLNQFVWIHINPSDHWKLTFNVGQDC